MIRYGAAATLARLADEMVSVSLVLLVLARTGDTALAGSVVAGYTLPAVLTGPVQGAWLGRVRSPRLVLVASEVALAGVLAALGSLTGHVPAVAVVALAAVGGVTIPFTSGGFSSLVPRLAGRSDPAVLERANTVDAVTFNLAAIGGPAVAGVLAATLGAGYAVAALVLVAVAAAVVTATLPPVAPEPGATPGESVFAAARAGLRHLPRTPALRGATVASGLSLGAVGLLVVALPARAREQGAGSAGAGYLWAAIEVGCALGAVLLGPRLAALAPERVVVRTIAAYGAVLGCWALSRSFPLTLGLAVLAGFAEGPTLRSVLAARQRYSPTPLLAQVATTGASIKIGAFAVGSALSGPLTGTVGSAWTLVAVGALQFAAAGLGVLTGRDARVGLRATTRRRTTSTPKTAARSDPAQPHGAARRP